MNATSFKQGILPVFGYKAQRFCRRNRIYAGETRACISQTTQTRCPTQTNSSWTNMIVSGFSGKNPMNQHITLVPKNGNQNSVLVPRGGNTGQFPFLGTKHKTDTPTHVRLCQSKLLAIDHFFLRTPWNRHLLVWNLRWASPLTTDQIEERAALLSRPNPRPSEILLMSEFNQARDDFPLPEHA